MPPSCVCFRSGSIMTQGVGYEHGILKHVDLVLTLLRQCRQLHLRLLHLVLKGSSNMLVVEPSGHVIATLREKEWMPCHVRTTLINQLHVCLSCLSYCHIHLLLSRHRYRGVRSDRVQEHVVCTRVLDQGVVAGRLLFSLLPQETLHLFAENGALGCPALGNCLALHEREVGDVLPLAGGSFHCCPLGLLVFDRSFVLLRQFSLHGPFALVRCLDAFALDAIFFDQFLHQLSGVLPC
mmetsp:Transcript_133553/g.316588  ORF Transcript_133553/g.316588 Transcript_133553/m.316588 type:complete len:237 (-) Transcript_133553:343-1053(-)